MRKRKHHKEKEEELKEEEQKATIEKESKRRRGEIPQSIRRLKFTNKQREEGYEKKISITRGHTTKFQKLERMRLNFKNRKVKYKILKA